MKMVIIVTTKKLLLVNLVLLFLIVVVGIGLFLFNNYLQVSYDPFHDSREYERLTGTKLTDEEVPNTILKSSKNAMDEYYQLLENNGVHSLQMARIVNILNTDGNYHTKFVLVNVEKNEIISTIYFRYGKDGILKSLTAEYRYFSDTDFLTYNTCLVMAFFLFISVIFAATSITYTFVGDGSTVTVESDEKISGNVYLKASRSSSTMYYDGVFRFVLYKKGLLGYSEYDREMQNTYKNTNLVMSRGKMSKTYYKGTLQLYSPDTTGQWSGITTKFEIGQN